MIDSLMNETTILEQYIYSRFVVNVNIMIWQHQTILVDMPFFLIENYKLDLYVNV